jgi:hypothetical protein
MRNETLAQIESRIQQTSSLSQARKAELLSLLATLQTEVDRLSQTHADQARSITAFTEISAHEATRAEQNPPLLKLSLTGLSTSVHGFEGSHPSLVRIVNAICTALSNSGV